jgi:hypothetical protein
MPLKLSELKKKTAERSFEYDGETVNLVIFTRKVTPVYRSQWLAFTKDPDRDSRCQLVADMLSTWDVEGDDGQPQPISYEFLQECPDDFLNKLVEAVEDALFPKDPTNASSSPSGSQPTTSPQEN